MKVAELMRTDVKTVDWTDALLAFHEARGRREKIVVWAHNSHWVTRGRRRWARRES